MNGAVRGFGRVNVAYRVDEFRPGSIIFWETQEWDGTSAPWNDGASYPWEGITRRHGKGATVAVADGSCRWWNRTDWDIELTKYPGRLWCNPGQRRGD